MTFRAGMCGEDNAFYDPDVPEVVLCYEHADAHVQRMLTDLQGETWTGEEDVGEEEWDEEAME